MRVLVLAPVGRDARLLAGTLQRAAIEAEVCDSPERLLDSLAEGVGAAIVAEEALTSSQVHAIAHWLEQQAPWSDVPFVILTSSGRPTVENIRRANELEALGNFTLALARRAAAVLGIEGNDALVQRARSNAALNALDGRATFTTRNLFELTIDPGRLA